MIEIKELIEDIKREVPDKLIFQDREYYSQPVQTWRDTYNPKKRQLDLGKLVTNLNDMLKNDPENVSKKMTLYRYFITVLDAEKHHLNYRAFRSEILSKYKDLIPYI